MEFYMKLPRNKKGICLVPCRHFRHLRKHHCAADYLL